MLVLAAVLVAVVMYVFNRKRKGALAAATMRPGDNTSVEGGRRGGEEDDSECEVSSCPASPLVQIHQED